MSKSNILLHVTGSISAFKAASLASMLAKNGYRIKASITNDGLKFLGEATLNAISGNKSITNMWDGNPDFIPHISLADWADMLLVYPASANCINRMAAGLADDLFGALFLANNFRKPVWIAPAMNSSMYANLLVGQSLAKLEDLGCEIFPGDEGRMACGTIGPGRLMEPERMFELIEDWDVKKNNPAERKLKVLITSGGCEEAIDGVRSITNFSSGKTGAAICDYFVSRGHRVVLLKGRKAENPRRIVSAEGNNPEIIEFLDFSSLENKLQQLSGTGPDFDLVIAAAAVSDFGVKTIKIDGKSFNPGGPSKISGEEINSENIFLELKKHPKLIDKMKSWFKRAILVGFKLSSMAGEDKRVFKVKRLFGHSGADFIVSNDLSEIDGDAHPFKIYGQIKGGTEILKSGNGKKAMAASLEELANEALRGDN